MKIAVSSNGKDLNAQIDPRFGRCLYFIIADTDTMNFEVYENANRELTSSAGIQSASFVASHHVKAVLTGNCGPKAADVFAAADISVLTGVTGTVADALRRFKTGELANTGISRNPAERPAQEIGGQAFGRGMGMGGGGGCRGGGGRGMGMGRNRTFCRSGWQSAGQPLSAARSRESELQQLKNEKDRLESQLLELTSRIKSMEQ